MKGLTKVFSDGLAILREKRMIGLLKGHMHVQSFSRSSAEEVDCFHE